MTEEMTCITTIALATRGACGRVEGEAIADEQPCVGIGRGAIAEEDVEAGCGLRLDECDQFGDTALTCSAWDVHGEEQGSRHGQRLVDALLR
ncbi:MAG: hypothetical protein FJW97_05425 [Actinobacteria bacterium]|nr:hypothetical protein [Actinomycetota bacterium]